MKFSQPNSKFQIPNSNMGQLLVEAMVAISIITTGLFGILLLLTNSLGLNKVVSDQYVGIYLASEGIEVMRSIVDMNIALGQPWNLEVLECATGCAINYNDVDIDILTKNNPLENPINFDGTFYTHDSANPPTSFSRIVFVTPDSINPSDSLVVRSLVTWTGRGGGQFSAELVDQFYNWRK